MFAIFSKIGKKYLVVKSSRHNDDKHSSDGGTRQTEDFFDIGHVDHQNNDKAQNSGLKGNIDPWFSTCEYQPISDRREKIKQL